MAFPHTAPNGADSQIKDASGGEAVRKDGTAAVQRTVRNDTAHMAGVPRVRSTAMPRRTRPHPLVKQRNDLAVLAVEIAGENADLIHTLTIDRIAVVGGEIGFKGEQVVLIHQGKELGVELLTSTGLRPVVTTIEVERFLGDGLGGHAQDASLFKAKPNELDTVIQEVLAIFDLGEVRTLGLLNGGLDLVEGIGRAIFGFIDEVFDTLNQIHDSYSFRCFLTVFLPIPLLKRFLMSSIFVIVQYGINHIENWSCEVCYLRLVKPFIQLSP